METDERRAQLLELGLTLFGTRSYDEVSIEIIASEAGISKGLLYHYFPSKRDFYVETVRAGCQELLDAVEPDPELDPATRARDGIIAYLDFVRARAGAYIALLRSGVGVDEEVAEIVEATRRTNMERMLVGIGLESPRPVFRLMARAWIGAVEAAAVDWAENNDVPQETLVEMLLALLPAAVTTAVSQDPDAPLILT